MQNIKTKSRVYARLIIIAALAIIFVYAAVAFAAIDSKTKKGKLATFYFGGVARIVPCTPDNPSGTCPASCPFCTKYGTACVGMQEVTLTPILGKNQGVLCPVKNDPRFRMGKWVMGFGKTDSIITVAESERPGKK